LRKLQVHHLDDPCINRVLDLTRIAHVPPMRTLRHFNYGGNNRLPRACSSLTCVNAAFDVAKNQSAAHIRGSII
jgi:hypothetical protein